MRPFFSLLLLLSALPARAEFSCKDGYAAFTEISARFGSHPTSLAYRQLNPKNAEELADANLEIMSRIARGESTQNLAEIFSGRHQGDMLQVLGVEKNRRILERNGFRTSAFINGVVDSDKGKTAVYRALLTESSPKSDLLLDTLRGNARAGNQKSVAALQELLEKAKLNGQLLNPQFTNDELRAVFKQHPMLQNYLHELPGLADAILAHEAGILSKQEFLAQVQANLFHNGPGKGFWNFFGTVLLPGALGKGANQKAKTFFANTLFQDAIRDGVVVPKYPLPTSFEGIFHTVLDRLSQGTRGGITKIYHELPNTMHGVNVYNDMLFNNPKGTVEQLAELRAHITRATADGTVNGPQGKLLADYALKAEKRVQALQEYIGRRVTVTGEANSRVLTLRDKDGVTHTFNVTDQDPQLRDRMTALVQKLLKEEEAANGPPMRLAID